MAAANRSHHPSELPSNGVCKWWIPQSDAEWQQCRDVITRLYVDLDWTLKDVQAFMESHYQFKATKRMYLRRLQSWSIYKNYKAVDKEKLATRIAEALARGQSPDEVTFRDRPVDMARVLRHIASTGRGRRMAKAAARLKQGSPDHHRQPSKGVRSADGDNPMASINNQAASQTPGSPSTPTSILTPSSDSPELDTLKADRTISDCPSLEPSYPSRAISPSRQQVNLQLILQQIEVLSSILGAFPSNKVSDQFALDTNLRSIEAIRSEYLVDMNAKFWSPIKMATYFLKTPHSNRLAWPLLRRAGEDVRECFPHVQFSFLRGLFGVISPGNLKFHPEVRAMLLKYLAQVCSEHFGFTHPIFIICNQLAMDSGAREVSQRSLDFMLRLQKRNHVNCPGETDETFLTQKALVSLYRRDNDLDAAERLAIDFNETCRRRFGIMSNENFAAMMELVYLYTYKGEYAKGAVVCSEGLALRRTMLGSAYPDKTAVYAMENMAEVHGYMGNTEECAAWLRQALFHSWNLKGGTTSTIHIRDKLEQVLKDHGQDEDAANLRVLYPTTDPEVV